MVRCKCGKEYHSLGMLDIHFQIHRYKKRHYADITDENTRRALRSDRAKTESSMSKKVKKLLNKKRASQ